MRHRKAHHHHSDYPSMTSSNSEDLCLSSINTLKKNMESLGLPAPESLFSTSQSAVNTASTLLGLIDRFGKDKKVGELFGAGVKGGKLAVLSTVNASFYVGAVIGSIAVATGRSLSGGTSIADALLDAQSNHLHRPWLASLFLRHPDILKRRRTK